MYEYFQLGGEYLIFRKYVPEKQKQYKYALQLNAIEVSHCCCTKYAKYYISK